MIERVPEIPYLTWTQIRDKVKEVAEEQPDTVIETCHYAADSQTEPLCLIGVALHGLDVPMDALILLDRADRFGDPVACGQEPFADLLGLVQQPDEEMDAEEYAAREFVIRAQQEQDSGKTWLRALTVASDDTTPTL